ncbi:hypothetical protein SAMN05444161_5853 [Rhizobiales bacterium GAS191]|nr:hypothetical protein SAMN05444161_5853 [Rhizobiales bacterium GAS191]
MTLASITKLLVSALPLILVGAASAASIRDEPVNGDPDVGSIVVQGEFVDGDEKTFNTAIQKYSKGIVLFESGGGDLATGLVIGTTIRMKGFRTGVAPGALCASSCALAWLGGVQRYLAPTAKLGFHAAYRFDGSVAREAGLGNALVGAYLTRIGLPLESVIYITKAAPEDMTWLTPNDAKKVGIDLRILDDQATNTASRPPISGPASPPPVPAPQPPGSLLAGPTSSPSFDCSRATRADEKAICADAILARVDALIASNFRSGNSAISQSPGTRYWLRIRNARRENCHSDVLCILTVQMSALRMFDNTMPKWIDDYKVRLQTEGIGSEWKAVLPTTVGECVNTSIIGISDRFGEPLSPYLNASGFDSGSAADFRNGGHVISYSKERVLLDSRNGDRVKMCLVSIPKNCPPGDDRGRMYRIINMRTHDSAVISDSQHMCGGA